MVLRLYALFPRGYNRRGDFPRRGSKEAVLVVIIKIIIRGILITASGREIEGKGVPSAFALCC